MRTQIQIQDFYYNANTDRDSRFWIQAYKFICSVSTSLPIFSSSLFQCYVIGKNKERIKHLNFTGMYKLYETAKGVRN